MVTHGATLDVPRHVVQYRARLLAAHRRRIGTPKGTTHVILDGTLIECDRVAGVRANGNALWLSQKNKAFGGNAQFLAAPDGTPLWVSDVAPGPAPDIITARIHVLPALYKAAAELRQRRRSLQYVTLRPSRIGDNARAALVLNGIWK
ncbi:hypothetical protein GCM10010206_65340 [Streptomyces cinerochromogenes]|nr:hypothetical protein GCM10010206_65340 [Streptomyces cinerochromogenes]